MTPPPPEIEKLIQSALIDALKADEEREVETTIRTLALAAYQLGDAQATERSAQLAEDLLHVEPAGGWAKDDSNDRLDSIAAYSNGTVKRIARTIRAASPEDKKGDTGT